MVVKKNNRETIASKTNQRKIVAFRGQINRISSEVPGAHEVKKLYSTLSDDAISLLFDFALAGSGLDLDAVKTPLVVGVANVEGKRAMQNYMRSVLSVQMDMSEMPRPYKKMLLQFIETGFRAADSKKYVRQLVHYYMRMDKLNPVYEWVDFNYLTDRMRRTQDDIVTKIDDSALAEYFMNLYYIAHTAVKRLKRMAYALASGARPHNLAKQVAKDDRFFSIVNEERSNKCQSDIDIELIKRFASLLGLSIECSSVHGCTEEPQPIGGLLSAYDIVQEMLDSENKEG